MRCHVRAPNRPAATTVANDVAPTGHQPRAHAAEATPFRSRGGDRHVEAWEPVARLVRSEADGGVEGSWQPSIKSLSCRNPVGYRTMRCRDIGGHWPENATAWAEGRQGRRA